jgi:hypothetical protein
MVARADLGVPDSSPWPTVSWRIWHDTDNGAGIARDGNALHYHKPLETVYAKMQCVAAKKTLFDWPYIIGAPSDWPGENGPDATARGMLEALMEAFPIRPVGDIGDRLPVKHGEVSEAVELDRPIGEYLAECAALEVVSVGWSCDGKVLVKPVARPVRAG